MGMGQELRRERWTLVLLGAESGFNHLSERPPLAPLYVPYVKLELDANEPSTVRFYRDEVRDGSSSVRSTAGMGRVMNG